MNLAVAFAGSGELFGAALRRHPQLMEAAAALARDEPETAYLVLTKFLDTHCDDIAAIGLMAETAMRTRRYAQAVTCYRRLAEAHPASGALLVRYGHALRTLGLREECAAVYRQAIALSPARGDAWWALATLATLRFADDDIAVMEAQLARLELTAENRIYMQFALGKAYGDARLWAQSFASYARANALRRFGARYDPETTTARVSACEALFTPEFFRRRKGAGCPSREPIFIVGMQRSGSTLIEQILASHSAIEGLGELPQIPLLANGQQPDALAALDGEGLKNLGERYLENIRARRTVQRPFFVDKQPYNFWHVGFIHLILPNARIIDVRRHPIGCCLSNFTTLLAQGENFSGRQSDLGRYYIDYARLTAHFGRVLPGAIYRVVYERLIADLETEVRALLDHLGLPFEAACVRFHENGRALDSASSEQVRRPINRDGVERWRHYEPWLGPLKAALGAVLDR